MSAYFLYQTESFRDQLLALPRDRAKEINRKFRILESNPKPDGKTKKIIKSVNGLCRLRCGDYRVLYTYQTPWVTLVAVDDRQDVYDKLGNLVLPNPPPPPIGGFLVMDASPPDPDIKLPTPLDASDKFGRLPDHERLNRPAPTPLPRDIDQAFLTRIRVPIEYQRVLSKVRTLDDLIEDPVPIETIERVFNALTAESPHPNPEGNYAPLEVDYEQSLSGPLFVTGTEQQVEDFLDGNLLTFLLKLDVEQEKHVGWPQSGHGPSLLRGGPGTGKSIVAIYRTRELVCRLKAERAQMSLFTAQTNPDPPRVLFTSFTNSLIGNSRQMLEQLIGEDSKYVEMCTADNVVKRILEEAGVAYAPRDSDIARAAVADAKKRLVGGSPSDRHLSDAIERISLTYLTEEVERVIVARSLPSLSSYLKEPRSGRQVPLDETQRTAVWKVYEGFETYMRERVKGMTYAQARREALRLLEQNPSKLKFDGVIVDEAQDLDPNVIRLLIRLCASTDRLFLTADASQCIYGSSFRWKDIDDALDFRGKAGTLRRNFRSTREIIRAANAYLGNDEPDADSATVEQLAFGPLPCVAVAEAHDEFSIIASYFRACMRLGHSGFGGCSVLVPTNSYVELMLLGLEAKGLPVDRAPHGNFIIGSPGVKVMTYQSAKGLEFPFVSVTGLGHNPADLVAAASANEWDENVRRARRTLYVAMTRAMRALLVIVPTSDSTALTTRLGGPLWHSGVPEDWSGWYSRFSRDNLEAADRPV